MKQNMPPPPQLQPSNKHTDNNTNNKVELVHGKSKNF
jgi:hypothetical protein